MWKNTECTQAQPQYGLQMCWQHLALLAFALWFNYYHTFIFFSMPKNACVISGIQEWQAAELLGELMWLFGGWSLLVSPFAMTPTCHVQSASRAGWSSQWAKSMQTSVYGVTKGNFCCSWVVLWVEMTLHGAFLRNDTAPN